MFEGPVPVPRQAPLHSTQVSTDRLRGDSNYGDLPHCLVSFSPYYKRSGSDRRLSGLNMGLSRTKRSGSDRRVTSLNRGPRCRHADKPNPVAHNGPGS